MRSLLLGLLLSPLVACSDYSMLQREDVGGAGDGDGVPFLDPDASDLADGPADGNGEDAWTDKGGAVSDTGATTPVDACEEALNFTGYLDVYQVTDDGRVLFCHSSSGNNFVMVESDIDSCLSHLDHKFDIFPSTLCDS